MPVRAAVLIASTAALVSGCAATAPTPPEAVGFPPRPVDIRTEDIPPCSMLTTAQGAELGLDGGDSAVGSVNGKPSPNCVWLSVSDLSYSAQTFPIATDVARSEPGAVVVVVNGFGAVRSIPRELAGGTPICQVTVDAGPGQSIRVQAQATGERPRTDEEMCRIATDVTGMVMTTVVATAGR